VLKCTWSISSRYLKAGNPQKIIFVYPAHGAIVSRAPKPPLSIPSLKNKRPYSILVTTAGKSIFSGAKMVLRSLV
jgi:hypothetical protein